MASRSRIDGGSGSVTNAPPSTNGAAQTENSGNPSIGALSEDEMRTLQPQVQNFYRETSAAISAEFSEIERGVQTSKAKVFGLLNNLVIEFSAATAGSSTIRSPNSSATTTPAAPAIQALTGSNLTALGVYLDSTTDFPPYPSGAVRRTPKKSPPKKPYTVSPNKKYR